MDKKLYVTNLSESASLTSLRQCFSVCGEVSEVEFAAERQAYRTTSAAFVTMATEAGAEQAMRKLNGTVLEGRSLLVTLMAGTASREGRRAKADAVRAAAAISSQYRERENMTYEVECASGRLILRMFFPPETARSPWRIEARSDKSSEVVVERTAATRAEALAEVAEAWSAFPEAPSFDWVAVTAVLLAVRAI